MVEQREQTVVVRGLDTLLFRDGRPFASEDGALAAQTLPLPLPGTLAGFLRTRIGDVKGWKWDAQDAREAREIAVSGPLLLRGDQPVFSAPADAVVCRGKTKEEADTLMPLRPAAPLPPESGCTLPQGLRPLDVTQEAKPAVGYSYWAWEEMRKWLLDADGTQALPPDMISGLLRDERTHVKIKDGVSEEGMLFTTQSLAFDAYPHWKEGGREEQWSLLARVKSDTRPQGVGAFGGERRIAAIEAAPEGAWPASPTGLEAAVLSAGHVRMVLATPALFAAGWKPDWLNDSLVGTPPELTGFRLRLVSAAVKRREAVSGWDYEMHAPKRVRWMVPAGSVYFFEIVEGHEAAAKALAGAGWLAPACLNTQDRSDGYGLALWGVWTSKGGAK